MRLEADHLLSPVVTVHCFWTPRCARVITDTPIAAHDDMERHYHDDHQADIARIVAPRDGWVTR